MKLSESIAIKITVLNFKTDTINIQRDMDINKYFLNCACVNDSKTKKRKEKKDFRILYTTFCGNLPKKKDQSNSLKIEEDIRD